MVMNTMPIKYAVPTGSVRIKLLTALAARYTGCTVRGWEVMDGLDTHPASQNSDRFRYLFGKTRIMAVSILWESFFSAVRTWASRFRFRWRDCCFSLCSFSSWVRGGYFGPRLWGIFGGGMFTFRRKDVVTRLLPSASTRVIVASSVLQGSDAATALFLRRARHAAPGLVRERRAAHQEEQIHAASARGP